MSAILGIIAFVLLLFTVGSVAENDGSKAVKFGAAFAVCAIVIVMFTTPEPVKYADCWIDWDGRSNATVCN